MSKPRCTQIWVHQCRSTVSLEKDNLHVYLSSDPKSGLVRNSVTNFHQLIEVSVHIAEFSHFYRTSNTSYMI